jgi:beta-galactosidase
MTSIKIKRKPGFMIRDEFTVYGNGTIEFASQLFPLRNKLPAIDCFGRQIRMKNGFGNIAYYGRGKDSYPDSYRHTLMGLHRQTIDKVGEEYSLCQECGNRLDVHYTAVTDDEGDGLMFVAREVPYQLKMSRISNIETASGYNRGEAPRQSGVYLDISAMVSGIGNTNDGLPLPQYLVKPAEHSLKFAVMPIMRF